jgi:hypothetical protein
MATPQAEAPPAKSRKVLWIVLGVIAFLIFCMLAFAAFGLYFVSRNLDMKQATSAQASESFESVRAKFKDAPIITLDADERVTLSRKPPAQPSSDRPSTMHVMAYDPDDERIVRVTIPFWMLRLGREKIRLGSGGNLEFEQLQISAEELERYGPSLLLDHVEGRNRVLVWTQ